MHAVRRVAVIGAGAAGLASARQLDRVGLDAVVFEASPELGGTWVYTDEVESDPLGATPERCRIHTSMYAALRTNLPRDLMAFREFPFDGRGGGDDEWLRFPHHEQVLLYLRRYAEHFGLLSKIRFEARVSRVRPVRSDGSPWLVADHEEPAGWAVRFESASGEAFDERFDAVVVCNGHYAHPRVPALEGASRFASEMLHSHGYRRAEAFAGKRVVLLGARASGIDIALEIAEHARAVFLCARGVKGRQPFGVDGDVELRPAIRALGPGGRAP